MAFEQSKHPECTIEAIPRIMAGRAIRAYQKYVAPGKPYACPYEPTCSQYGLEAIETYGVLRGGALAAYRILRCNPFSHGGCDPVP